jgi:hypothetical protein
VGGAAAGRAAAGAGPGRGPPLAAWRSAAVLRRRWAPSPCRGAARCSRFYRWPTTDGPHARLSACVARGTPTHCDSASWASSGRCPSPAVCGFPAVWVVCEDVRCGVRLVAGGCLSLVRGGGVFRAVGGGLRLGVALVDVRLDVVPLPPRSSSPTVAGCLLGGFPVGHDWWGGERVVGGVLPRIGIGDGVCVTVYV